LDSLSLQNLVALVSSVSNLHDVLDSDLLRVIDDVLVMAQMDSLDWWIVDHWSHRNNTTIREIDRFRHIRSHGSNSFNRLVFLAWNVLRRVFLADVFLHLSEGDFAQEKIVLVLLFHLLSSMAIIVMGVVVCLDEHVSEVNTSSEHMSSVISFRRSDSESSLENTDDVLSFSSVPKKHLVPVLVKTRDVVSLIFPLNSEDVADQSLLRHVDVAYRPSLDVTPS
jgi:hypothetical protein